jgi:hypothetical protein
MFFIFHDGFIVSFIKLDVYTSVTLWLNQDLAATTLRYKLGAVQRVSTSAKSGNGHNFCIEWCSLEYQRAAGADGIAQEAQACGDGA